MMISCPEEIAYRLGYIGADELKTLGDVMKNNQYGQYLLSLAVDEDLPFHGDR
jgi:glucose-1-phosphate thymidylyltransferase